MIRVIILSIFMLSSLFMIGHPRLKNEQIVVFKKEVHLNTAISFLSNQSVSFHEGADSSRGKIYFYKTGPKFIVNFPNKKTMKKFIKKNKNHEIIYEIYKPNWNIQKD